MREKKIFCIYGNFSVLRYHGITLYHGTIIRIGITCKKTPLARVTQRSEYAIIYLNRVLNIYWILNMSGL